MPKSRVTIISDGQTVEIMGSLPVRTSTEECTTIKFPCSDGSTQSSTIRAYQDRHDIQSITVPAGGWTLIQKA